MLRAAGVDLCWFVLAFLPYYIAFPHSWQWISAVFFRIAARLEKETARGFWHHLPVWQKQRILFVIYGQDVNGFSPRICYNYIGV